MIHTRVYYQRMCIITGFAPAEDSKGITTASENSDTSPHYTIPMVTQIIEFYQKKVNKLFTICYRFSEMNK